LKRPIDSHGKLRFLYGKTVVAVQGDIGSTFALGKLPPGAVRLIYPLSYVANSAWGASATLAIGHAAYRSKQDQAALNDGIEPASVNALMVATSMTAAARAQLNAALLIKYDFYSLAGVDLVATLAGAVVPVAATLEWLIAYLYE
jgi:hypothetical protein